MWHHLSLPLLWCSPSEKSSLFSFYYLEVLWDAVMHRLKCQKIGFWWDCCILLALNHFTQLSLIISHFRWIWNHITSKWDWSFLITSGQTATWRTIIFILTFFFLILKDRSSVFVSERTRLVLMCSLATVCHHCF